MRTQTILSLCLIASLASACSAVVSPDTSELYRGGGDGGIPLQDAGPPEPCGAPGTLETVSCGNCGTMDRFCSGSGVWENGPCTSEGICAPGTMDSVACGNCGTQASRCTATCTWEELGECSGEGTCAAGTRTRSAAGCPTGSNREVVCSDACIFVPEGECESDACPSAGAFESVACGNCGMQDRFCSGTLVWEYGPCTDEGVCAPGTIDTVECGMCGGQSSRCTTACVWEATGVCSGEGECTAGSTRRSSVGCPAGQTRLEQCNDACSYSTVGACMAGATSVDVMVLLDMTGSHGTRIEDNVSLLETRLIAPLLALGDVAVGISYYADFPTDPYGSAGDAPFVGGVEPTRTASIVNSELRTAPLMGGNDTAESGIEALSVLTGGSVPSSGTALSCSSGRTAGGCWRPGARRVIVLYTDAAHHNGPALSGVGLYSPYVTVIPAPAVWTTVRSAMTRDDVELIVLRHSTSGDIVGQTSRMLTDLGQPSTNSIDALFTAGSPGPLGTALDAAVSRVRAHAGL